MLTRLIAGLVVCVTTFASALPQTSPPSAPAPKEAAATAPAGGDKPEKQSEAQAEPPSPSKAQDDYLARAVSLTHEIEGRIWRLNRFEQPVAWARLYAVWQESARRHEARSALRQPDFPEVDPDNEVECRQIRDPWLHNALSGISRRSETPSQKRQRVTSAAMVLGILAPFGQGLATCFIDELQSKKKELNESRPMTHEEHEMLQPAMIAIGEAAERFARNEDSFERAVGLAHMAIQLRSAFPLGGFLGASADTHADKTHDVLQEAFDSIQTDWDPVFVAELGDVVFPVGTVDAAINADQYAYLGLLEQAASAATKDNTRRQGLCDLAAVAQKLIAHIDTSRASATMTAMQYCKMATTPDAEANLIGHELRTPDDYVQAANTTSDWDQRVRLKMSAARLALESDPLHAVEIVTGITDAERAQYRGSWRAEAQKIATNAAKKLYALRDLQTLERVTDKMPNKMRGALQVAVAEDALGHKEEPESVTFMTRHAYRTLEEFETDDSEALVSFVNLYARALPQEATPAMNDAMKWLNRVLHPTDPWRDPAKAQSEKLLSPAMRDAPQPLGRQMKPVRFDAAVAKLPVEAAAREIKNDSDFISVDLGLIQLMLRMSKLQRAVPPPTPVQAPKKTPE